MAKLDEVDESQQDLAIRILLKDYCNLIETDNGSLEEYFKIYERACDLMGWTIKL